MKRLLTFVAAAAAFVAAAAENLLKNADFARAGATGVPAAWTFRGTPGAAIERPAMKNGFAVRLAHRDRSPQCRVFMIQSRVPVVNGGNYLLSVKYRGEAGSKGLFYIERGNPYWVAKVPLECTDEWQEATIPVTVNDCGGAPYVAVALMGGGMIEVTAPELVAAPAPDSRNLLKNPGFRLTRQAKGKTFPLHWNPVADPDVRVVKCPGGGRAVRMNSTATRSHLVQNGLKLKSGRDYLFSLRYRGAPGAKALFYLERGGHVLGLKRIVCSDQWQTGEVLVAMPADNGKLPYAVLAVEAGGGYAEFAEPRLAELAPRGAGNMLRNGDFALTATGEGNRKLPSLWSTTNGAVFEIVPGPDGKNAVRFRPDPKSRTHFVQWGVPLAPGKDYLFSIRYRGTPGTSFIYGVERGGKKSFSRIRKDVKCSPQWQTLRHLVHVPEEPVPNVPYAVIAAEPGGEYFEVAELRIFPAEAKLRDGDFEAGGKEWTLENAVITDETGRGKVVRLDGTAAKARIRQGELLLKRGRHYELSYDARGGADTRFTDSQNATWYRLTILADGYPYSSTANWQDSFSRWQHKSITFTANRDATAELVGELRDPGTVYFDNIRLREIDFIGIPLEVALDAPWNYRRGADVGTTGEFSGAAFIAVKADKLRITFNGRQYEFPAAETVPFKLPVPGNAGRYVMTFEALSADGKVLARVADNFTVRGKAPKHHSHVVTFDEQHRMYLDGKPFFPIMTWRNRGPIPVEESYPRFVDLGFNIIECPIRNIDVADAAGLYVLPEMPEQVFKLRTPEQAREYLGELKRQYGRLVAHPAVVGYFSVDEPTWRGDPLEPYAAGYRLLRDGFDPWRPVYINEAPRGGVETLRPVMAACDIYGVDIYPIPSPNPHSELADKTVTSVGKYTDICREVSRGRKPIWMCLQGFAWGTITNTKEIYPTYDETRFMAFDAIAHGATGLVYWGLWMGEGEDPEFLAGLKKTLREVTALGAYLVGDTIADRVKCDDKAVRVMQKRSAEHGDLWIVLNESPDRRSFTLDGDFPERLVETSGAELPAPREGKLAMTLPGFGVRVFRDGTRPAPAPLHVPRPKRKLDTYKSREGYKRAAWIWYPGANTQSGDKAYFRQEFDLGDKIPARAELSIACDDMFRCYVNGVKVMEQMAWSYAYTLDVSKLLKPGRNEIRILAADAGGPPCGLLYALLLDDDTAILSGAETRTSRDGKNDWIPVEVLGKYGIKPWTKQVFAAPYSPPEEPLPLPEK